MQWTHQDDHKTHKGQQMKIRRAMMRPRKHKCENKWGMEKISRAQVMGNQGVKGQGVGSEEGGGVEAGQRSKSLMMMIWYDI